MKPRFSRALVWMTIAFVTPLVASSTLAQTSGRRRAPTPSDAAESADAADADSDSEADPDAPLDEEGAVRATWAARVEYHRQLRSTDLSELSSAASTLGYGIYSLTRDEPFSRGMGGALVAGGGIHLVSGILFTIRSQRGMSPETAPASFREGNPLRREVDDAEHRSELFIAYLLSDTSAITGGVTTTLVGIARDKPVTQGVGLGLISQGVLTLVLDLTHQNQNRAYLRTLRDLQLRVRVETARVGNGAVVSLGWVL